MIPTTDLLGIYKQLNESDERPECYRDVTKILLAILKELKERVLEGKVESEK